MTEAGPLGAACFAGGVWRRCALLARRGCGVAHGPRQYRISNDSTFPKRIRCTAQSMWRWQPSCTRHRAHSRHSILSGRAASASRSTSCSTYALSCDGRCAKRASDPFRIGRGVLISNQMTASASDLFLHRAVLRVFAVHLSLAFSPLSRSCISLNFLNESRLCLRGTQHSAASVTTSALLAPQTQRLTACMY